jgi:hypothetical protein
MIEGYPTRGGPPTIKPIFLLLVAFIIGCGGGSGGGQNATSGSTPVSDTSFTPPSSASPPVATTLAATSVGATTATLNGNVTANGLATNAWFEYGTDPTLAYSISTSPQSIGSGTAGQSVDAALSGLATGTTYSYRVAASNGSGTTRGSILSFTPAAGTPSGQQRTVSWSAVTQYTDGSTIESSNLPVRYDIRYVDPITLAKTTVATGTTLTSATFNDTYLVRGRTYTFYVTAFLQDGSKSSDSAGYAWSCP